MLLIFYVTVKKDMHYANETDVVYEGDIIISDELEYDAKGTKCISKYDIEKVIDEKIKQASERCVERAKWIFGKDKEQ